jgi:site-specific recombinase XerD
MSDHSQLTSLLEHIAGAYSPNTLRAYRADMEEFIGFCERAGVSALPAEPETVARFLIKSSETGIRSSTVRRKESSISAIHRLSYLRDPTKHPEVKIAIRKIERKIGTHFGQAYPIDEKLLRKLLAACGDDLRGTRNRALLLLAYESLRRRSELVSLRIEDVDPNADGSAVILLRKSKTDQTLQGSWIGISATTHRAIRQWVKRAEIKNGPILRSIKGNTIGGSLGCGQINRILKSLARKASLAKNVVDRISGHSTRVGRAQDLLKSGASLPQMMHAGGWSKPDTVMRYVARTRPSLTNTLSIDL